MNRVNKYFLVVARTGNIKKASEQLYVTQPTLTTAIKKLEDDLGVPLFVRRSKGVELTEYGEVFLSYVEDQQSKELDLFHKIQDMYQREKGKLKIGVGDVWWESFVRQAIVKYHETYTNSSLYIEFGSNLSLMQHLIQGDIDLFIGHEVMDLKANLPVVFRPILQDKEAFFVKDDHPLLQNTSQLMTKKEIFNYPIIRITPGHQRYKVLLNDMFHENLLEETKVVFELDSLFASIDLLKVSDAVMPYSDKMLDWMQAQGVKCCYIDQEKIGNVGIYHKKQLVDEKVQFLIDAIYERVNENSG